MAVPMEELEVVQPRAPSTTDGNHMIPFPQVSIAKDASTPGAFPLLSFEQERGYRLHVWVATQACTPIEPIAVKGAFLPL